MKLCVEQAFLKVLFVGYSLFQMFPLYIQLFQIIQQATGNSCTHSVVIAVAGMAKVFVGELIEEALDIKDSESSVNDPLLPRHLRLAHMKMDDEDRLYPAKPRKSPF